MYLGLVQELQDGRDQLAVHKANAPWQRKQYQALQENTPPQWLVATTDFAENYLCVYQSLCLPVSVSTNLCLPVSVSTSLCVYQDEVQSAHWGDRQITIHPVVLHYRCHCLQNVTEYMIFLTDDLQKDGNMVKAITDRF